MTRGRDPVNIFDSGKDRENPGLDPSDPIRTQKEEDHNDPIEVRSSDPIGDQVSDSVEVQRYALVEKGYPTEWPIEFNKDEEMGDINGWDRDKEFRVDLSNQDVYLHVSKKEWADRWRAYTEDLVMGKVLKVEQSVQGGFND